MDANILASLRLILEVNARRRIFSDQDRRKTGLDAADIQALNPAFELPIYCFSDDRAFKQHGGHA
jgi:hypothetical protein